MQNKNDSNKKWDPLLFLQLMLLIIHLAFFFKSGRDLFYIAPFILGHSWSYAFLNPQVREQVRSKRYRFSVMRFLTFFVDFVHRQIGHGKDFNFSSGLLTRFLTLLLFFVLIFGQTSGQMELSVLLLPLLWGWALGEMVQGLFPFLFMKFKREK